MSSNSFEKDSLTELKKRLASADQTCLADAVGARFMPAPFDDSTHQIWFVEYKDGSHKVLKFCDCVCLQGTSFWSAMEALFSVSLLRDYFSLKQVYRYFEQHSAFKVPELEGISCEQGGIRWLLTRRVKGEDLESRQITQKECHLLAEHLTAMHAQPASSISFMGKALSEYQQQNEESFQYRIAHFIEKNSALQQVRFTFPDDYQAIQQQLKMLRWQKIVPMLIDFRWDQLRVSDAGELYLLDLDAALFAPLEMDWLMLELVLNEQQLAWVKASYPGDIPEVTPYRALYRALFYAMGLLGELPWPWWREQPIRLP